MERKVGQTIDNLCVWIDEELQAVGHDDLNDGKEGLSKMINALAYLVWAKASGN
ncbi:MAG: hypothetical protein PHY23_06430 [Oscillospiraceae bacterium]|nr:hypothetical protein [Oscillospiraceae bacterium]